MGRPPKYRGRATPAAEERFWAEAERALTAQEEKVPDWIKEVAQRVRAGREAIGITRDEMAVRTGITAAVITHFETGASLSLGLAELFRIAVVLQVEPWELLPLPGERKLTRREVTLFIEAVDHVMERMDAMTRHFTRGVDTVGLGIRKVAELAALVRAMAATGISDANANATSETVSPRDEKKG